MRRLHLLEIEDQSWCPVSLRDAATDYLQFSLRLTNAYAVIVPRLQAALDRCKTSTIIDLAAVGSGPWPRLLPTLALLRPDLQIKLTDKFPNHVAFATLQTMFPRQAIPIAVSVDATSVPDELRGFRTMFTAFHHLPPALATAVLADAVRQRQGIGIFEATQRRLPIILSMLITPLLVLLTTPVIPPPRLSRYLWTYVVPLLPLLVGWDGVVSCLRTYTPDELRELIAAVPDFDTFTWEVGEEPIPGQPVPITYLVGYPVDGG